VGVQEALLKALGQRVRELRAKRGYSQEAFADRCGVHRTFMGTIERGETNLSFQNLVKVANALGITLAQMLSGIEKKAEQLAKNPSADE
jgi:transcriptional regulator with XRE-family HTH domain